MRYLNTHREILLSGRKLSHGGSVYWIEDGKVFMRSVEDELSKKDTAMLVGRIGADGIIRRIGNKFKSVREAAGFSVAAVAKGTGISINTLLNYDQGQRHISLASAEIVYKIARFFGISMEELFEEDLRIREKGEK